MSDRDFHNKISGTVGLDATAETSLRKEVMVIDESVAALLTEILDELKKLNSHMMMITDIDIEKGFHE